MFLRPLTHWFTPALLPITLSSSGCAWQLQNGSLSAPVAGICDESPASPFVDLVLGGLSATSGVAAGLGKGDGPTRAAQAASGLAVAGVFIASAAWGFMARAKCRALRAQETAERKQRALARAVAAQTARPATAAPMPAPAAPPPNLSPPSPSTATPLPSGSSLQAPSAPATTPPPLARLPPDAPPRAPAARAPEPAPVPDAALARLLVRDDTACALYPHAGSTNATGWTLLSAPLARRLAEDAAAAATGGQPLGLALAAGVPCPASLGASVHLRRDERVALRATTFGFAVLVRLAR